MDYGGFSKRSSPVNEPFFILDVLSFLGASVIMELIPFFHGWVCLSPRLLRIILRTVGLFLYRGQPSLTPVTVVTSLLSLLSTAFRLLHSAFFLPLCHVFVHHSDIDRCPASSHSIYVCQAALHVMLIAMSHWSGSRFLVSKTLRILNNRWGSSQISRCCPGSRQSCGSGSAGLTLACKLAPAGPRMG